MNYIFKVITSLSLFVPGERSKGPWAVVTPSYLHTLWNYSPTFLLAGQSAGFALSLSSVDVMLMKERLKLCEGIKFRPRRMQTEPRKGHLNWIPTHFSNLPSRSLHCHATIIDYEVGITVENRIWIKIPIFIFIGKGGRQVFSQSVSLSQRAAKWIQYVENTRRCVKACMRFVGW